LDENFLVLGKAAGFLLRIDFPAVEDHVEDTSAAFNQLGFAACLLLDRIRQTGGLRMIVSLHAIRDGDLHRVLGPFKNEAAADNWYDSIRLPQAGPTGNSGWV